MNRRLRLTSWILLSLAVVTGSLAGTAQAQEQTVLGNGGEVYSVIAGPYGELFPEGIEADPTSRVLALRVECPDEEPSLLLVPFTEGEDEEDSPALFFEENSNTLFLVWEQRVNFLHAQLNLLSFSDQTWSELTVISRSAFTRKSLVDFSITRDTIALETETGEAGAQGTETSSDPVSIRRTVLHLVWREQVPGTAANLFYTPLVFLNGTFIGERQIQPLAEFADPTLPPASEPVNPELLEVTSIRRGSDDRSVVIGFVDSESGRLITIEVRVVPSDLSQIADGVRGHLIDLGHTQEPEDRDLQALADGVRGHLIDLGARLRPANRQELGDRIRDFILASDPTEDLEAVADRVRGHLIDLGAQMDRNGLTQIHDPARGHLIDLGFDPQSEPPLHGPRSHDLVARVATSTTAPLSGSGDHSLYLSSDGNQALVAWSQEGVVFYRETTPSGWSDTLSVRLGNDLSLEGAQEILRRRAQSR